MTALATAVVTAVAIAVTVAFAVFRRRVRRPDVAGTDVAAAQRTYLTSNWADVETAMRRSGMDADEIADVRKRLLGV